MSLSYPLGEYNRGMKLSDEQWKQKLSDQQYEIMRKGATEAPFSGSLLHEDRDGIYVCAACGTPLFSSKTKFEATTPGLEGWPSFHDVVNSDQIELKVDESHGMYRTEIVCKTCGGHLGHFFDGVPDHPSGKHYCINSACLAFNPEESSKS